jgi:type I restriction enzyme S subunit
MRLGDQISWVKGFAFKSQWYANTGRPVVRVSDFTDDSIDMTHVLRIPEDTASDFARYALVEGDIVIQTVGSWPSAASDAAVGRVIRVPRAAEGSLQNQNTVRIRTKGSLDQRYLFYRLKSDDFRGYLLGSAHGSGQASITLDAIFDFDFTCPPLDTQRQVSGTLSAYDDLIENNTRRIAILEEMARALYREWFVEFRFPGHEGVRIVESAVGLIPEGWEVTTVGTVADVNRVIVRATNAPEVIEYVDIASVSTGRIDKIERYRFEDAPGRARRIVTHGDVIWSTVRPNRRSYSLILNPPANLIVSTGFAVLSAHDVPFTYLFHATTTGRFAEYLTNRARGAAYPAVTGEDFASGLIVLPPATLLDAFHTVAVDNLELKHLLEKRNQNLSRTRDLLLPKLVAGEIEVATNDLAGVE